MAVFVWRVVTGTSEKLKYDAFSLVWRLIKALHTGSLELWKVAFETINSTHCVAVEVKPGFNIFCRIILRVSGFCMLWSELLIWFKGCFCKSGPSRLNLVCVLTEAWMYFMLVEAQSMITVQTLWRNIWCWVTVHSSYGINNSRIHSS